MAQKRQTVKITGTNFQRTFTFTSTDQLNGQIERWIDQLKDRGQMREDTYPRVQRVLNKKERF